MDTISVDIHSLQINAVKLNDIATNVIERELQSFLCTKQDLCNMFPQIESTFSGIETQFHHAINNIMKLSDCLKRISDKYTSVEERLVDLAKCTKNTPEIANPTDATPEDGKSANEKRQEFVDNYEYTYSQDDIAVPIHIEFLDKNTCLAMAEKIIEEHGSDGQCNGMSKKRIAKELYAHAIGYFAGAALEGYGIDGDIVQDIMESGEVANIGLGDGLDLHYNLIWFFMDPLKLVD